MDGKQNGKQQGEQRAPRTWGMASADFYAALQNKTVSVSLLTGKAYIGEMVGVDQYDLILSQASGLMLLIPKHAVAFLHASKNGGAQAS